MRERSIALAVAMMVAIVGCGGAHAPRSLVSIESCLRSAGYTTKPAQLPQSLYVSRPGESSLFTFTVTIMKSEQEAQKQAAFQQALGSNPLAGLGGGAATSGQVIVGWVQRQSASDINNVKRCAF
jgi:hypothetical protein